jgi:hypothetical protein
MQIPGEHKDVYVSSTLTIVIFTTVIFGGLTEPMLTRMSMRVGLAGGNSLPIDNLDQGQYEVNIQHDYFLKS